jgi:hypothetical protein
MVIFETGLNSHQEFKTYIARIDVNVIEFDGFPESLDPSIIGNTTFSIHRYFDVVLLVDVIDLGHRKDIYE